MQSPNCVLPTLWPTPTQTNSSNLESYIMIGSRHDSCHCTTQFQKKCSHCFNTEKAQAMRDVQKARMEAIQRLVAQMMATQEDEERDLFLGSGLEPEQLDPHKSPQYRSQQVLTVRGTNRIKYYQLRQQRSKQLKSILRYDPLGDHIHQQKK